MASEKKGPTKYARYIPENWTISDDLMSWTLLKKPHWSQQAVHENAEHFKNHYLSASGEHAKKRDWDAAYKTWVFNNKEKPTNTSNTPGGVVL